MPNNRRLLYSSDTERRSTRSATIPTSKRGANSANNSPVHEPSSPFRRTGSRRAQPGSAPWKIRRRFTISDGWTTASTPSTTLRRATLLWPTSSPMNWPMSPCTKTTNGASTTAPGACFTTCTPMPISLSSSSASTTRAGQNTTTSSDVNSGFYAAKVCSSWPAETSSTT